MVRRPFLLTGISLTSYKQDQKETYQNHNGYLFWKNKQTNKQKNS